MTSSNIYASNDPAVIAFIANQNTSRPINSTDPYMPQQDQNGVAGTTTDNVVGISSIAAGAGAISLGSGFNTVIVDGEHSTNASTGGAADSISVSVDGVGTLTLLDNNSGQSETITGASFLIFNDASIGADSNGNPEFSSIYFIGDANQSEIVRLYTAALGRQPDLGGVEYYSKQLAAGLTFTQIADEFMASPEFATRYGSNVSDTQFVTNLYQNVLHRTPDASELAFYVAALANQEAGSVVNTTNPVLWTREIELLNFTNSPEDQSHTSGFVINTDNGGYADSTAVTGFSLNGAGNVIYLSYPLDSVDIYGPGNVVYGAPDGNSYIQLPGSLISNSDGGTVYLYGTGNTIGAGLRGTAGSTPSLTTIFGFVPGDYIDTANFVGYSHIYTPTTSAPLSGASITWLSNGVVTAAVNVGQVTNDSAAAMANAANAVYKVGDVANENATFFGEDPAGNTVIYHWTYGDYNSSGQVQAQAFTGGEVLIGVPPSSITAANVMAHHGLT